MRYCKKCLMPDSKPYLEFDKHGVCYACNRYEKKCSALKKVGWDSRQKEFDELVDWAKSQNAPYYDALVPVSGGKDSITQVYRLLGKGLRILSVNVDYGIKTDIGRENLDVIPTMGSSLSIFRPELSFHTKLIRIGFKEYGDPDLFSHTLLYSYPIHTAITMKIPLVLLGENSADEYSGEDSSIAGAFASREWFMRYVANAGNNAERIAQKHDLPINKLKLYDFPSHLEESGTKAVFSSYFSQWDSEEHLRIARQYGFKALDEPAQGTYRNYVGIDEKINRIHQYFKVLKFGYGRGTDHACEDIRRGRLTREEAKELVRKHDLEPLSNDYIKDFCEFVGMEPQEFDAVMEQYRNTEIWEKDSAGDWTIPDHLKD